VTYVLDTNVFIQAHRQWYGRDIVPAFWDWLVHANRTGTIVSLADVRRELTGQDDAATWAKEHKDIFRAMDPVALRQLKDVAEWANQNYAQPAVNKFLTAADCSLVAFAQAHQLTVVTHEKPEDPKKTIKEVKIPGACKVFHVPWVNTFNMLRAEKAKFVLNGGNAHA